MWRDCKAMEAIDVEAIDVEAKDMNRKDKEVKDMSQVHLTPLSAVVDEVWGEKGSPRRDAMERRLQAEVERGRAGPPAAKSCPESPAPPSLQRSACGQLRPLIFPPKTALARFFLGKSLESQRLFLPLHRQSSPSLFTMLKSCEAFFCLCPLAHGRSYGLCQTAWIPQNIGILGKSEKACQLRKKVSTSERSCSSVKWSVASYVLCVALSFPS